MGLPIKKNAKSLPTQGTKSLPTQGKAKQMMDDGEVRGKPITTKQRGLFGIILAGKTPTKVKK
jgi:hypothetical protein